MAAQQTLSERPKRLSAGDMSAMVAMLSSGGRHKRQPTLDRDKEVKEVKAERESEKSDKSVQWLEVGVRVEAKDSNNKWYSAKVVALNDERTQAFVHFERWSARFDEWLDVQTLRRTTVSAAQASLSADDLTIGEQVLARWTDGRRYQATVTHLFDDRKSALVVFDDNYRKKVKLTSISKLTERETKETKSETSAETTTAETPRPEADFKCDDCHKTFRKAELLSQHRKHYHDGVRKQTTATTTSAAQSQSRETTQTEQHNSRAERPHRPPAANRKRKRSEQQRPRQVWSAAQMAERHESAEVPEVVHCVCVEREESGLMVRCDACLCWQHALCQHFPAEQSSPELNDDYVCAACRRPALSRRAPLATHALNALLKTGRRLDCHFFRTEQTPRAEQEDEPDARSLYRLLESVLNVRDVIASGRLSASTRSAVEAVLDAIDAQLAALERRAGLDPDGGGDCDDKLGVQLALEQLFNDLRVARTMCENQ